MNWRSNQQKHVTANLPAIQWQVEEQTRLRQQQNQFGQQWAVILLEQYLAFSSRKHQLNHLKAPLKALKTINKIGKPKTTYSINPTSMPIAQPKKKPLKVLLFPKMRLPSKKFLPKSIFVPPPASTGVAFAQ